MELKEILQMADNLTFAKTGQHLDDLQQTILQGTLEGKKYAQIADESEYAHGYVRESASELWQLLSEVLGEEIKKTNCRSTFERLRFSNHSSHVTEYIQIGNSNINICQDSLSHSPAQFFPLSQRSKIQSHLDLDKAPFLGKFYGRERELNMLKESILQENCQLIAIHGLIGIGKTALSLSLIEQIKNDFSCIIYRKVSDFKSLVDLQLNLLETLSTLLNSNHLQLSLKNETDQRKTLINFLQSYHCLIILDNVQTLFQKGKLAAYYQPDYQNYAVFLESLGTINHQSSIILNTREVPREIINLSELNSSVRLFRLSGLGDDAQEILKKTTLQDQENWTQLINCYDGHPQWLTIVGTMIKELFNGRVKDFLNCDQVILPDDLILLLNTQFDTLSGPEKIILTQLSHEFNAISLVHLLAQNHFSSTELLNILQSLMRRSLVKKIENDETQFQIENQVIAEYCQQFFSASPN